ncbi:PucR family transcriptional regulator ligand-binding domain-containing protein [Microbacterium betulae]|uniref:PucR family transcriptional regulator ligand-binding domain-containing protein n=1 Tax=Microbacterium betulae TaxID=2981139 RepID=A0AA97I6M5_9MICO|nr:PucR family transcriptional regulator ligand-binding domain-containing protein [Microbacterium sp. AB]WOF23307.1 PucR family transcriptional regulator ligand-binding domain-containing protein [Microbacterium sp. AB]
MSTIAASGSPAPLPTSSTTTPPTLRSLLRDPALSLRLLGDETGLPAGALDRPISWVHSSDLADPTPFLVEGNVLLTTGTQFDGSIAEGDTAEYVARLRDRGVTGLGFGTEVVRDGTPSSLVVACARAGIPLFEVPYQTPFIAVARANANALAAAEYSRGIWALTAQRAISLAALRPDGLGATLAELSRHLGAWVGLYGATGDLDRAFPEPLNADDAAEMRREVTALLAGGRHASRRVLLTGRDYALQTLGAAGELRGVLAVGRAEDIDQAGQQVVNSVVALAWLSLQQNRDLVNARGHLRSGLLHALRGGDPSLVARISAEMWGPLPGEPIRVAAVAVRGADLDIVSEVLELRVASRPGELFFARGDASLVLCAPDGATDVLTQLVERFEARIGLSEATGYAGFGRALEQAEQALRRRADAPAGVTGFSELAGEGVLAFVAQAGAGEVARSVLAPLTRYDETHGTALLTTMRTWFASGCEYDAAAGALGVHRHTVRSRIDLAARLLGRDLGSFAVRADVWAAFVVLDPERPGASTRG